MGLYKRRQGGHIGLGLRSGFRIRGFGSKLLQGGGEHLGKYSRDY